MHVNVIDGHIRVSVCLIDLLQSLLPLSVDSDADGNECGNEKSPMHQSVSAGKQSMR